ncbi:MAG: PIN domain-containing protein [Bryobacterales bacterium]|nr:PIN domain-containing protein [Bryobacterales bacterium]MBV9401156.1 PIN domain-containing protein [Bryobacterales bacterium]
MPDVNILVYAYREELDDSRSWKWLTDLASGPEPFAISELVLHGFLRVVTNPKIFLPPSSVERALEFIDALLRSPGCHLIRPGALHWSICRELCVRANIRGSLIADAVDAALAIESGCEWVTADTDFARFSPPLRWRHLS